MKKKKLGNTNLHTSPVVFGGNVFGWTVDKKKSFELMDEFLDMGFNMIDTADIYSRWADGNSGGVSETIIGEYMKTRQNRDKIVLITKVGSSMQQGGEKDISRQHIMKAVDDSLSRLKTDYIDLYFSHFDDKKTPVEETLDAYASLIQQGKVRHIGASNFSAARLQESLLASRNNNLPKYEVYQPEYNLMNRDKFEGEIQNICAQYDLGVISYFSLASGFLTGKYTSKDEITGTSREPFLKNYFSEKGMQILNHLKEIADSKNISEAAVALRWIMQRPGITAPIASATKMEHLKSFQEAVSITLNPEEMEKLS